MGDALADALELLVAPLLLLLLLRGREVPVAAAESPAPSFLARMRSSSEGRALSLGRMPRCIQPTS